MDIRPDRMNETEPTDDEAKALDAAGYELSKGFHDYGNGDLVNALRIGYALGRADQLRGGLDVPTTWRGDRG